MERRRFERRTGNLRKSAAWAFAVASSLIISAVLLTRYLQFLLATIGRDW